ncbi:uncharacterized protein VICG_02008 [Vittaforma corneae ATCC 50505]|uniref:Uncharacterized protein n=1 Tax=Vittaforma corneae (strain ATCC 50505) TaxID=993615 RepID=L2GJC0_VITCO|nr:uncharacterized protein VICG_02008 [Vittaforma corneae ATCC 50505]ELA40978.1 hypothetical protein VICG_02008 [Vittaforma corneae ATCC 50505]
MKSLCLSWGHDIEITSVEHAFLILFYLYREKDMHSYMCLDKRKLIDIEKATKFYQKIILLFKEAALCASRVGDVIIFPVKTDDLSTGQIGVVSVILNSMFKMHLEYRNEAEQRIIQSYTIHKTNNILYSETVKFENEEIIQIERMGHNMVKIESKDLPLLIRSIVTY